jgi:hypothetical protein
MTYNPGSYDWLTRAPVGKCQRALIFSKLPCESLARPYRHSPGHAMFLCEAHSLTGMIELTMEEYKVWRIMDS